jgi:hypothetical protein
MLVDMGFESSQVVRALKQCQGDFDIALELLTTGNVGDQAAGASQSDLDAAGSASLDLTQPLSAADEHAVNELTSLGFSKEAALLRYLASNRNEELAADQLRGLGVIAS